MQMELKNIEQTAYQAVLELVRLDRPHLNPVELLVVGCSSSEIAGGAIGHMSSPQIGEAVCAGVLCACREWGCQAAFQCCEHLNRALVVERQVARARGLEVVCVVPQPKAGGSLATAAWRQLKEPVAVEALKADAGLDIGGTLIGMHLRPVAVPVRLENHRIGQTAILAARTRPKLIGGERAHYA